MFQYAFARALQAKIRQPVYLEIRRAYIKSFDDEDLTVKRDYGLNKFCITLKTINLENMRHWRFLRKQSIFEKIIFQLSKNGFYKYRFYTDKEQKYDYIISLLKVRCNAYIMGHFFNINYFKDIRKILLKEFHLKDKIRLDDSLKKIFTECDTVSVHIRRGDYLKHRTCLLYDTYYPQAMSYIESKIDAPYYLIFTDDPKWVTDNLRLKCDYKLISNGYWKDYEELYLMSKCRNNIIANSTFSYWGAWLNENCGKIVTVPKGWMPSIIPREWTII